MIENPSETTLKVIEAEKRLVICRECDKYIKLAKVCKECRCFMPMKARLRKSKCPLEKW